ncbi:MAG: metallophosphoesterase [Anaerolinea sp.]|nr:metallophosphoesterase [Anaerolinea sp.]MCC6974504.1 metallophosphoesterase [Anaerolineae bacterium]
MLRFIHLSDTHIGQTPDFANYGHNSLKNLEHLISHLNALPFPIDFVLHTGDVVEDRSEQAYRLAQPALAKLKYPIYYVAGNHDDPAHIQRVLLAKTPDRDRFDYQFSHKGVAFAVFDSRGPHDPAGALTEDQLSTLRDLCQPIGAPLVIILHHPPAALDCRWLDEGWTIPHMLLENRDAFMDAILPARDRLRGVFFGHVHRAYQVFRQGVLFSAAPSTFGQLLSFPEQPMPAVTPEEPAGYNLVTINGDQTTIRQHYLGRP